MITLQLEPRLAALLSALALGLASPVQAQRSALDGVSAQANVVALAPAATPEPTQAQAFDAALLAYERCHWSLAFGQLVRLAEVGHAQAARAALQMHRHGPALYGEAFVLSPQQAASLAQVGLQVATVQVARER